MGELDRAAGEVDRVGLDREDVRLDPADGAVAGDDLEAPLGDGREAVLGPKGGHDRGHARGRARRVDVDPGAPAHVDPPERARPDGVELERAAGRDVDRDEVGHRRLVERREPERRAGVGDDEPLAGLDHRMAAPELARHLVAEEAAEADRGAGGHVRLDPVGRRLDGRRPRLAAGRLPVGDRVAGEEDRGREEDGDEAEDEERPGHEAALGQACAGQPGQDSQDDQLSRPEPARRAERDEDPDLGEVVARWLADGDDQQDQRRRTEGRQHEQGDPLAHRPAPGPGHEREQDADDPEQDELTQLGQPGAEIGGVLAGLEQPVALELGIPVEEHRQGHEPGDREAPAEGLASSGARASSVASVGPRRRAP